MTFRSKAFLSTVSVALMATGIAAEPAFAQKKKKRGADAPVQVQAVQVQAQQISSEPVQTAEAVQGAQAAQPSQQAPAAAAAPMAQVAAGAQVRDTNGGDVGTIASVDGQFVILKTDRNEVRLPASSFAPAPGHLLFAMTRDQINAEVDKSKAQASASLVAGAVVTGAQGGTVGTIESIDSEFVTLKLGSGKLVRLPRAAVAASGNGGVVGATSAELEAAAAAAGS